MKAAIYIRVSTDRQHGANQETETVALCKSRGWKPYTFAEVASGAKNRSVWQSVLARCVRGEFGAVACWALDRIGRTFYAIHDAIRILDAAGVVVATVREPWLLAGAGIDSAHRALMVSQFAWAADFERRRIVERINAGLARARREGKTLGRRPALDGATAMIACDMRADGASWRDIASELHERGHRTIRGKKITHGTVATVVTAILGKGTNGKNTSN